jgi:hypothetical protein
MPNLIRRCRLCVRRYPNRVARVAILLLLFVHAAVLLKGW